MKILRDFLPHTVCFHHLLIDAWKLLKLQVFLAGKGRGVKVSDNRNFQRRKTANKDGIIVKNERNAKIGRWKARGNHSFRVDNSGDENLQNFPEFSVPRFLYQLKG